MSRDKDPGRTVEGAPLLEQADLLLQEALRAGAIEAEVYLKQSQTTEICLGGVMDGVSQGLESGAALRVWDEKGKVGHASSSLDESKKVSLIQDALAGLRLAGETGSPSPSPVPISPGPAPPFPEVSTVREWSAERKRKCLHSILGAAMGEGGEFLARYRDARIQVALCNSRGFSGTYGKDLSFLILAPGKGRRSSPSVEWVGTGLDLGAMAELVREFEQLDVEGQVAQVEPNALFLRPAAAVTLIQVLAADLIADPQADVPSTTSPPEGDDRTPPRWGSPEVSVVDDGLLSDGPGSAPFDGEGTPMGRLTLMKKGICLDRLRKRRDGDKNRPGSMQRVSYQDPPTPSGTNLFILPGPRPASSMRAQQIQGYELAFLQPVTGGMERSAPRWWQGVGWEVREGLRRGTCRRIAFQCSSTRLLEGIREVSNRPRFYPWRGFFIGSPDLWIRLEG